MFQVKDAKRPQVNVLLGPGGLHVRDRYGEEVRTESAGRGGTEGIKDVGGPLWVPGKGSCSCLHPTMTCCCMSEGRGLSEGPGWWCQSAGTPALGGWGQGRGQPGYW